jgi:hypothetical protein
LPSSTVVLSCHVPAHDPCLLTLPGGQPVSAETQSSAPFLGLSPSRMSKPSPTLAPDLEWLSSLVDGGERGAGNLAGTRTVATSHGQRQWDLNSFAGTFPSYGPPSQIPTTSSFMVTTPEWLKGGGIVEAKATRSTVSSEKSMNSLRNVDYPFTLATSPADPILLTSHPVASTHPQISSSQFYPFEATSSRSSATLWSQSPLLNAKSAFVPQAVWLPMSNPLPHPVSSAQRTMIRSDSLGKTSLHSSQRGTTRSFYAQLPPSSPSKRSRAHQSLELSPFRPSCAAGDRLRLWRPLKSGRSDLFSTPEEMERIILLVSCGWKPGTRELYGSGLLAFHIFCDNQQISEMNRGPASIALLQSFVSALAGSFAGGTIVNYLCGVRAWHFVHGLHWDTSKQTEMELLLKGAAALAPPSSHRPPRKPYTVGIIEMLRSHMNLTLPLDASVFSCLTSAFWGTNRLGELTVRSLLVFDPLVHIKRCDVRQEVGADGAEVTVFFIPKTKTSLNGEDTYWAKQDGLSDPETALKNHLSVNGFDSDGQLPLFAYRYKNSYRPLTRSAFDKRMKKAFTDANLDYLLPHALRIGSVLTYLMRGLSFDRMKVKGRWTSEAFSIYLRRHAQLMAPHIQSHPTIHQQYLQHLSL